MTLIPSDAAGKAINRESIFESESLPRHPLPSRDRSLLPGATNILTPASGFHPRIIPLPTPSSAPRTYIYIYTHTPAFPHGFNTEEHLSLSCTLHSSSRAKLNRPARVRLLVCARCARPLSSPPFHPVFHHTASTHDDLLASSRLEVRLASLEDPSNGPWHGGGGGWGRGECGGIPARIEAHSGTIITEQSPL